MRIIIFCLGILISWLSHQGHNYPSIEKISPRNLIIMDGNNNCQLQGKQFSHWLILCFIYVINTCGGHFIKDWKVYHCDWQKKSTFCPLWPKLWGFKVERIKKHRKSAKFGGRFGVRLTFWPATQAKKVEIHSGQSYKHLKFGQKVPKCGVFLPSEHPVGIF